MRGGPAEIDDDADRWELHFGLARFTARTLLPTTGQQKSSNSANKLILRRSSPNTRGQFHYSE